MPTKCTINELNGVTIPPVTVAPMFRIEDALAMVLSVLMVQSIEMGRRLAEQYTDDDHAE